MSLSDLQMPQLAGNLQSYARKKREYLVFAGIILVAAAILLGSYLAGPRAMMPAGPTATPGAMTRLPPRHFGDWNLLCVRDKLGAEHCRLVLQVVDATRHRVMLRLVIARGPRGRAALVALTPPNAVARDGVKIASDRAGAATVPFIACGPHACQAGLALTDAFAAALAASATMDVSFTASSGRTVGYKLPNAGFASAYSAWLTDSPAAQGK